MRACKASLAFGVAVKRTRRKCVSSAHKKTCAELSRSQPGSLAMHRAMDSLATCSAAATIPTLRHPRTSSPCASPQAKADAFAAFAAEIASPRPPGNPCEAAMRDRAAIAIAAERAVPTAHEGLDELFMETEIAACLH